MKHTFTGMMIALMLVLALVISAVALAENTEPEVPETPAVEQTQPEQAPAEPAAPATDAAEDSVALQEALKAYNEARSSSRQEALEAELKGYVESGKLTQEQADLILDYYNEQQSLRDGACPNCGYQFRNGQGKGGRGNGNVGGKGNRMNGDVKGMDNRMGGFGGKGGRGMMSMNGMNGQQPSQDQQPSQSQDGGSAEGMAFGFGAETLPDLTADDFI